MLTQEGKSFLVDAKRLVTLSLESIKSVQRASRGESGQLNLGYLFKFNFDLLPSTLSKFYQTNPEISVNLSDMSPAEQFRSLEVRKIDLGFVGFRPPPTHKNMPLWFGSASRGTRSWWFYPLDTRWPKNMKLTGRI